MHDLTLGELTLARRRSQRRRPSEHDEELLGRVVEVVLARRGARVELQTAERSFVSGARSSRRSPRTPSATAESSP